MNPYNKARADEAEQLLVNELHEELYDQDEEIDELYSEIRKVREYLVNDVPDASFVGDPYMTPVERLMDLSTGRRLEATKYYEEKERLHSQIQALADFLCDRGFGSLKGYYAVDVAIQVIKEADTAVRASRQIADGEIAFVERLFKENTGLRKERDAARKERDAARKERDAANQALLCELWSI